MEPDALRRLQETSMPVSVRTDDIAAVRQPFAGLGFADELPVRFRHE
jgi:hypothetical protein